MTGICVRREKSTDQGLEQDFNSLDAQREASEAYIKSQAHAMLDESQNLPFSSRLVAQPQLDRIDAQLDRKLVDRRFQGIESRRGA
jgi:site-specific DNA recombinase